MGARGMPVSLPTIADYAFELAGEDVGINWAKRFKKRHPDLKVKWTTGLEECRARALNRPVVHEYFELLRETIERYDIKSKNIYNMDEKVVALKYSSLDLTRVIHRTSNWASATRSGSLLTAIRKPFRRLTAVTGTSSQLSNVFVRTAPPFILPLSLRASVEISVGEKTIPAMPGEPSLPILLDIHNLPTVYQSRPTDGRINSWADFGLKRTLRLRPLHFWMTLATIVFSYWTVVILTAVGPSSTSP